MTPKTTTTQSLTIERTFKADPAKVWAAFTDPKRLATWFAPGPMDARVDKLDVRVGGGYKIAMVGPETHTAVGKYTEVVPQKRLVFTWAWEGSPDTTEIVVELTPVAGGTKMVFTHRGFATKEDCARHKEGWDGCFAKLVIA